jgi:hypothetical protein
VICRSDVVRNWPSKLSLKDENLPLFSVQAGLQSSQRHKMVPAAFLGYLIFLWKSSSVV